ncbi:MAG: dihydroorotase [Bacteroidetes bacterium]|nr:dihydroorotase [Bacteroidota bacterium]
MQLLIKSAKVVDPNSPHHNKTISIFIENGIIKEVSGYKLQVSSSNTQIIEADGLHISPGFFDMQVNFRDPGHEYKEDLLSGCASASAGGFTGVAVMPGTHPPIDNKSQIEYVKRKIAGNIIDVFPVGAITQNTDGKELSEMFDMHSAGAVAFSDDKKPVSDSGLLLRALLYAKNFNGLLLTHCDEKTISLNGQMNEGKISTSLGLKGIPALAEEVMVARNLFLCEYTSGRIHFSSISTAGSVQLIREAKKKKLKVTASVNAYNLALDDLLLKDFDTNYKVNPPLRTKEDIASLKKGLTDGTIDAITSDHSPEDVENKNVEFDYAAFGMIGVQTAFAIANTYSNLKLNELVKKFSVRPREIFGLPVSKIKAGEKANLTLFLPNKEWKLEEKNIRSKSKNTPFIGKKLKGKIVGVVNNGSVSINA